MYHSKWGLFLYRKTAAIRIILHYVWSTAMSKHRGNPEYLILCVPACIYSDSWQSCVSRGYGEISFITWQLLIAQELVCSIMVYFKNVVNFAPSIKMITWTNIVLCFLNYSIFETWFVQTNWSTCGEWMGYFGFYNTHLWQSDVSRFFVDLRIGR